VCNDVWPRRRASQHCVSQRAQHCVSQRAHIMEKRPFKCHPTEAQLEMMDIKKGRLSKAMRQIEKGFIFKERQRMKDEDRLSGQCESSSSSSGMPSRPAPKYMLGQSVLHFWASWMAEAKMPMHSFAKSQRPKWYSAEILSPPTWIAEGTLYAGFPAVGWGYKVF
jgi:hypothetical protein